VNWLFAIVKGANLMKRRPSILGRILDPHYQKPAKFECSISQPQRKFSVILIAYTVFQQRQTDN
jgi:hypothetical protein